mmetsp:Transcript_110989/g.277872  ORF Transcript_110989/g.277872 Transcript_110989/m.277872 type:complete len:417 (+) Transcript_110989:633-1883(+)
MRALSSSNSGVSIATAVAAFGLGPASAREEGPSTLRKTGSSGMFSGKAASTCADAVQPNARATWYSMPARACWSSGSKHVCGVGSSLFSGEPNHAFGDNPSPQVAAPDLVEGASPAGCRPMLAAASAMALASASAMATLPPAALCALPFVLAVFAEKPRSATPPPPSPRNSGRRRLSLPRLSTTAFSEACDHTFAARAATTSDNGRPPSFRKSSVIQTCTKAMKQGVRTPTIASSKPGLHDTTMSNISAMTCNSGWNCHKSQASARPAASTHPSQARSCLPYLAGTKLPAKSLYSPIVRSPVSPKAPSKEEAITFRSRNSTETTNEPSKTDLSHRSSQVSLPMPSPRTPKKTKCPTAAPMSCFEASKKKSSHRLSDPSAHFLLTSAQAQRTSAVHLTLTSNESPRSQVPAMARGSL